ncbi:MAG: ABC transporter ATP-binding protein [Erysipelotrichaceae bacterium]|nr:ABC transporter ATP-binding protein [Erysipelotrichaceae bacterium]MDD3923685.1 ABC transporter ATP-binding protein [Erysipelotrichaceae bacterium]MDD4642064.1 ABC transporter ATP-binding protein [Erysipelotrichaceae bacterium]
MSEILSIKQLTKTYPNFTLNKINLDIPNGTVVGLIGENGAGKTTLIKSILNITKFDSGSISIFGNDLVLYEKIIKNDIGVVLDDAFFADTLKIKDIIKIVKHLYKNWNQIKFDNYLTQFNLPKDQVIKTFSKGMKKKLEIAVALSHDPKLLILDEPTSGLDPIARNEILEILRAFIQDEQHAILISSHITTDLEHIADYISFINNGNLIFTKTQDELLGDYGIIKCNEIEFKQLAKNEYIAYRKNTYNIEILTNVRPLISKKYPRLLIERPTIEDIMMFYIKGDK